MNRRRFISRTATGCLIGIAVTLFGWLADGSRLWAEDAAAGRSADVSLATLLPLITDEAVAAAVVYPQRFFASPAARRLPIEVASAELHDQLGVDPSRVEFAIAFLEQGPAQTWSWGVVVKLTEPFDWRSFPDTILRETVFGQLDGRPYRKGRSPLDASLMQWNPQVMVLAPDDTLCRMLGKRAAMPSDDAISQQLSQGIDRSLDLHLAVNLKAFRPLMALHVEQPAVSEAWQAFGQLLDEVERIEVRMRLSGQLVGGIMFESTLPDGGLRIQGRWSAWCEACQRLEPDASGTADQMYRFQTYLHRSLGQQLSQHSTRVAGNRMHWGLRGDSASQTVTCAAILILLDASAENLPRLVERWQASEGTAWMDLGPGRVIGEISPAEAAAHR